MYSLAHALRRAASANPQGAALRCAGRSMTWPQVLERTAGIAAALRSLGIRNGDRVGILAANSDDYFLCLHAIPWAGGIAVPINTRLAEPEMRFCADDAGCRALLVDAGQVAAAAAMRESLAAVEQVVCFGGGEVPQGVKSLDALLADCRPCGDAGRGDDDVAALYYTGGTTGRAKGVMLTHASLLIGILQWANALGVTQRDRFLIVAPMFHLVGGLNAIATTMLGAQACVLARFDAPLALREIEAAKATKAALVPVMVDLIVEQLAHSSADVGSLRKISYGGAPMTEASLKRAMAALPHVGFYQVYGQTEGGPSISVLTPEDHVWSGARTGKLRSAGKPLPGTEVAILDARNGPLPPGATGEIGVRGLSVSPGYWNLPEETAKAKAGGWLHTGDVGYIDDEGFLFIVDRLKDMIITGGENVYSTEVENALSQHPAVAECAVIGIPSARWGEAVHAVVRLAEGAEATDKEIIAFCRQRLAGYKCPRSIEFRTAPFPLSGTNKVLKRELRKPHWQ